MTDTVTKHQPTLREGCAIKSHTLNCCTINKKVYQFETTDRIMVEACKRAKSKHCSTNHTYLVQHNTDFNSSDYPYMYATCFGLYLGHPQTCQYKTIQRKIQ
jgi:hypothetical protein